MNHTLAVPLQEKNLDKHPRTHLHSPGLLARWPLIGVMMVLLGGLLFGAMAINLQTHGPLLPVDVQVANDLHCDRPAELAGHRRDHDLRFLPGRTRDHGDWTDPGAVLSD